MPKKGEGGHKFANERSMRRFELHKKKRVVLEQDRAAGRTRKSTRTIDNDRQYTEPVVDVADDEIVADEQQGTVVVMMVMTT